MSIYLRFFDAVFSKGIALPNEIRATKWVVSPFVPGIADDPESEEDESVPEIPEVAIYLKPVERRALSLVASRAGKIEY